MKNKIYEIECDSCFIFTDGTRNEKLSKKPYDPAQFAEATNGSAHDTQLQEKIKLLEMDYKALHDKRLQDVSFH